MKNFLLVLLIIMIFILISIPMVLSQEAGDQNKDFSETNVFLKTGTENQPDAPRDPVAPIHRPLSPSAVGDDCGNPIPVAIPADLPYFDEAQTTCGRGYDYSATCLGEYDGGEDIIYELTVAESYQVDIILGPIEGYTGICIDNSCPPGDPCIAFSTKDPPFTHGIYQLILSPGTYYVMVDCDSSYPGCLSDFDLNIVGMPPCVIEATITAPGTWLSSTNGSGDNCTLRVANDIMYEVVLPYPGGTWTFSTCGSSFDTWVSVGRTCCGSYIGINDDFCDRQSQLTVCVLDETCYVTIEGFAADDSGDFVLEIYEAETLECPDGTIFGQRPPHPCETPIGSDISDTAGVYISYDNFHGVTDSICDIHWWGHEIMEPPYWYDCTRASNTFVITFYTDDAGFPDEEVCSYTVTPTRVKTGYIFSAGSQRNNVYEYHVVLEPCCYLDSGWVSIVGVRESYCYFAWIFSNFGDNNCCFEDTSGIDCGPPSAYADFAFCLTRARYECSVDSTGVAPGTWTGNTCGENDDCSLLVAEDHIYRIYIPFSGVWTFSLCGSSFDTYLGVGTTCCSQDIYGNDDFCEAQSEFTIAVNAGSCYVTIEGYDDTECGDYVLNIYPADTLGCPEENTIFSQLPHRSDDSLTILFSDTLQSQVLLDNFSGLTQPICDIHWWGFEQVSIWHDCARMGNTFDITFYDDAGGDPRFEVCSYTVNPTKVNTGYIYAFTSESLFTLYVYSANLSPCCTLEHGWVSIAGIEEDVCKFMWLSSEDGDDHCCGDTGTGPMCGGGTFEFDLAFCLTGEEETCVDSSVEAPGTWTGNTCGEVNDCNPGDTLLLSEDYIYEVVIADSGEWTFSLCGSSYDTKIAIGTTCCSADIGYNDDACGLQSEVTVAIPAGTYYVTVDGYGSGCGDYTLAIYSTACSADSAITAPGIWTGNTCGAVDDCHPATPVLISEDYIYEVTIPDSGSWIFSLCGSSYDTKIGVGTMCCSTDVGFNDDACDLQSEVIVDIPAGTYYVIVDGYSGACGDYILRIIRQCAPDFSVTAPYLSPLRNLCDGNDCPLRPTPDHVYEVLIPDSSTWMFSLCESFFDTWMALGLSCCGEEIDINDDSCGLRSFIIAALDSGIYYVTIEGFDTCGDYILQIWDSATPNLSACLSTEEWEIGSLSVAEISIMDTGEVIEISNCGTFPFDMGLEFITVIDTTTGDTIDWVAGYVRGLIDTFSLHAQFTDDSLNPPLVFHPANDMVSGTLRWSTGTIFGPQGFNILPGDKDYLWLKFLPPAFSSFYDDPLQIIILIEARLHLP